MTPNEMRFVLGERVRRTRQVEGLSQEELARRVRLSRPALVNMELGRQGITVWRLCQLAEALHTPAHIWLMPERDFRRELARALTEREQEERR